MSAELTPAEKIALIEPVERTVLIECPDCGGDGEVDCSECQGGCEVECDDCDGNGVDDDGNDCDTCEGNCYMPCDECSGGGTEECSRCNGEGEITA